MILAVGPVGSCKNSVANKAGSQTAEPGLVAQDFSAVIDPPQKKEVFFGMNAGKLI
jgi:hypothetical protein